MTSDIFSIGVPAEELAPATWKDMPTGRYVTTLDGAELVENAHGWQAIRVTATGFENTKTGETFENRTLRGQFTVAHATSTVAVDIGMREVVRMAEALGLTETENGNVRLIPQSYEALVDAVNALVGSPVQVYVKTGERKRGGEIMYKDDGVTPWIDSEIKSFHRVS